jgi:hypothetical protein
MTSSLAQRVSQRWPLFSKDPEGLAIRLGASALDTLADPSHRRLQGLVESLALAAQIPVPKAMVMEDHAEIEAFALGWDRQRTVLAVSRGAIDRMSRQELHGLLAIAISRIMTGEVRQSTRMRVRTLSHWSSWLNCLRRSARIGRSAAGSEIVAHLADEGARVHQHLHASRPGDDSTGRLLRVAQDTAGAGALLVALLQDDDSGQPPPWGLHWLVAGQHYEQVRELLAGLEPDTRAALRWPLTELALARMSDLGQQSRLALLVLLREVLAQSESCAPRAWLDFALMTRRLAPEVSPSTLRAPGTEPVAARHVRVLCAVFACMAEVHEVRADRTANALIRVLGLDPVGGSAGTLAAPAFGHALVQLARLPADDRELLVQGLPQMLNGEPDAEVREWLRLLRLVIDAPTGRPARVLLPESIQND